MNKHDWLGCIFTLEGLTHCTLYLKSYGGLTSPSELNLLSSSEMLSNVESLIRLSFLAAVRVAIEYLHVK